MGRIPVTFEHKGNEYSAELVTVHGVAHRCVSHLLIDNRYYGTLMHTQREAESSEWMPELEDFLGDYVVAWHQ